MTPLKALEGGSGMAGSGKSDTATVAIAATFTAEPLLPALQFVLGEVGLSLDVRFAPYNQVFQELLSSTSLLATNKYGVNVLLVRFEDFARVVEGLEEALNTVKRSAAELADAVSHQAQRVKVPILLAVMPPSPRAVPALQAEIQAANAAFLTRVRSMPGIFPLEFDEIERVSPDESYDGVRDDLAHIPFTENHYAAIALAIARKVHAFRVPAHKVLALDCDETLWRGVLGEDGVDGISIPPGIARLQQFAVDVQAQGVLVCLVSKNTEREVLEVFEKRSDMTLSLDHVVAHRINWEPKPRNLAALAQALSLGLESFVFIDDNPVECAMMRAELPQVVTLQLPPDDEIESFLAHLWTFDKVTVTNEDSRRTSLYREDAARQKLEESTTDIAEFLTSLDLAIDIAPPDESERGRLAQLTQRTNQFNFTTVRRTESEIRCLARDRSTVMGVKVRDRFGDYGLVGLVIVEDSSEGLDVDTFLLSCRVLGRGVEHAIMRHLGELAKQRGLNHVNLRYIPTPRNEPARDFAESVADEFCVEAEERIVYHIPVERASTTVFQPGSDWAATTKGRVQQQNTNFATACLNSSSDRSERYAKLAHTLVSGASVLNAARTGSPRSRTLPGRRATPVTETEEALLALWEENLGIEELGVEDDYFAVGGTSLLAASLIAEISRRFDVRLPFVTILEASTVRALSRHLEPQHNRRVGSLIELKGGGPRKLFLVHDGEGETLLYVNLARRMPDDLAVFGIEPRRLPGVPLAHTRIKDMAGFYVEQMRKQQPHGPYLLGGMCAGGVIAYEMASQLVRNGENVDLLVLLDAARPKAPKRPGRVTKQRLGRLKQALADTKETAVSPLRRAEVLVAAIAQKVRNALVWEISQRCKQLWVRARFRLLRQILARDLAWPRFVPQLSARQIYESAEAHYTPQPLSISSLVLMRARHGEAGDTPYREVYADDTFGWEAVTHCIAVIDVDGGHFTMLQEGPVDSLAADLLPFLHQQEMKPIRVRQVEEAIA
jgi:FkbH-like protein